VAVELVSSKRAEDEYNELIRQCADANFYHTLIWRDVLRDVLGDEPVYLVLRSGGSLTAALPGFIRRSSEGGVYNSLPWHGSFGGVVLVPGADRAAAATQLVTAARELAADEGCMAGTIFASPRAESASACERAWRTEFTRETVAQITLLDRPLHPSPSVRNHVRKAERAGLEIEDCMRIEELPELWDLHAGRSRPSPGSPKQLSYFVSLYGRAVGAGAARFMGARRDGRLVAAIVLVVKDGSIALADTVLDRDARRLQAPSLLIHMAIDWAVDAGCSWLLWGTATPGSGVYEFRRAWGTRDIVCPCWTTMLTPMERLQEMGRGALERSFPGYYVAPFDAIEPETAATVGRHPGGA